MVGPRACSRRYPIIPIRYKAPSKGFSLESSTNVPLAPFPSVAPMSNNAIRPPRLVEEGIASINQAVHGQQPSHSQIRNDVYAAFFELVGTVESSPARAPRGWH